MGQLAEHLLIRHHSTVGLVDRAVAAGLVERHVDPDDRRMVRVSLTEEGADALGRLSINHLTELGKLVEKLLPLRDGTQPPVRTTP